MKSWKTKRQDEAYGRTLRNKASNNLESQLILTETKILTATQIHKALIGSMAYPGPVQTPNSSTDCVLDWLTSKQKMK